MARAKTLLCCCWDAFGQVYDGQEESSASRVKGGAAQHQGSSGGSQTGKMPVTPLSEGIEVCGSGVEVFVLNLGNVPLIKLN